jgi:hypothetical protein
MSFARILRKLAPAAGSTFYDLGSGTGRAVFVARISQDFSKCIGTSTLNLCLRSQRWTPTEQMLKLRLTPAAPSGAPLRVFFF